MAIGWQQETERPELGWKVVEHPFWTRWAGGELTIEEIALFACEYDHVATAIATAAARASRLDPRLAESAERERWHLNCWREFSRALGWGGGRAALVYGEEILPETELCARLVAGERHRPVDRHLLVLGEIDAVEGAVGEVMLNGLLRHYGFSEGPATKYFSLHAGLGVEAPAGSGGEIELVYWKMLDGVEALGVRSRV